MGADFLGVQDGGRGWERPDAHRVNPHAITAVRWLARRFIDAYSHRPYAAHTFIGSGMLLPAWRVQLPPATRAQPMRETAYVHSGPGWGEWDRLLYVEHQTSVTIPPPEERWERGDPQRVAYVKSYQMRLPYRPSLSRPVLGAIYRAHMWTDLTGGGVDQAPLRNQSLSPIEQMQLIQAEEDCRAFTDYRVHECQQVLRQALHAAGARLTYEAD